MVLLSFYIFCFLVVAIVGALSARSDFCGLKIPNWHSAAVIVVFVVFYGVLWLVGRDDVVMSLSSHILSALIVFGVTLAMFASGALGAADSKLGTAFALWVGLKGLMPFLFYMALTGGVLALFALALRKWKPIAEPAKGGWVASVQGGESKVPYGIAIVIGALASFVKIGYFDSEVLTSFIM